ncbi:MAG: ChbG/HpnK family deacetylase [Clostridia bacterium]|nr:ChbG/HpnK family deacetylase [Clostridia bacterium]
MIYFSADDYGLSNTASMHIQSLIDEGKINKVSVFPNFDKVDLGKIKEKKDVLISLHLNLVEGRCMADADEIDLIADKDGNFRHTFGGLLKSSLFKRREFEKQVKKEIRAQVRFWKNLIGDRPFLVDGHQHTHMIPSVFRALSEVLKEEQIKVEYIRIPAEPLLPYIKTPSLYLT